MVVHSNPELWATRERWNACDKCGQSVARTEQDILGRPWVMAADEAGCLLRNGRGLQEQSAASGVRHGGTQRNSGNGTLGVDSPGRAVAEALGREFSAVGGANFCASGNGISLRCG